MAYQPPNLHVVSSADHFKELLSADLNRVSLLNFWAPWAEPCKQMNEVAIELAKKYPNLLVLEIEAEELTEITESFEIEAVPSFIILRGHTLLGRISGADAVELTNAIAKHIRPPSSVTPRSFTDQAPASADKLETEEELNGRLQKLMNKSKVVLFMKGTPELPRCGFSRRTVELLRNQNIEFSHFDILKDESVRQGLKKLNNWPTFPQVIIKGELVGGLDIVTEMADSGELKEVLA